ncbi:MAG: DUF3991 and toprim domain-containing protein [Anaerovorax sp.]|nr:DUF3991 and toprim domain-containing protein [Anaerovorax sp.]
MGKYIHFTEEEKRQANNIDLEHFLRQQGETLLPSGREKRLKSNHSITVRGNEWYDHATEKGGLAIDFVQNFYGLSFPDAVTMLIGGGGVKVYHCVEKKEEIKKPFVLPPKNKDMRRTFAYLIKHRCIDKDVVNFFVKEKLLYESCEKSNDGTKEYHNAIFVGLDEIGVARHAHKRGIYTNGKGYKGNIDSSNPCYSFHFCGTSDQLYVFEAPIDMLSFISLHKNINWKQHSYIALCGLSEQAMLKQLGINPTINKVVLCLDNDKAGIHACEKFKNLLYEQGIVVSRVSPALKDFNEDLKEKIKNVVQDFEMIMA